MLDRLANRITRMQVAIARAALIPFLVKVGIALSFLAAITVAWPASIVRSQYVIVLMLVALYPAVAPRGRGPTAAVLAVVAGWVADTSYYGSQVELWRVIAIGTLLYLGHTLAALAAVLPFDGTVNLDVVLRWVTRAGVVVAVSAVLTVIALGLADVLGGGVFVVATVAGLAAAVGATMLLARLLRRPGM